jgi:two-component system alkaline phosphatase synthesis response regulator PhoP
MSNSNQRILVVDDEPDIVELLNYNLTKEGYEVRTANNGQKAIEVAKEFLPQLILMDIMMPKMDGVEATRKIKDVPKLREVHVIFLTARAEEYSEVAAFEAGADDYITKPIKPRALLSRVTSFFRKGSLKTDEKQSVTVGDLVIDRQSYTVMKGPDRIILPKKEFELLYFLAHRPDTVFSRDELLRNIWGTDVFVVPRTVDVHVRKVREKVGEDYITTVKGIGYKFALPA